MRAYRPWGAASGHLNASGRNTLETKKSRALNKFAGLKTYVLHHLLRARTANRTNTLVSAASRSNETQPCAPSWPYPRWPPHRPSWPLTRRALRPSTRLHVFKEPTTPKPVEAPRRPKSKLRPRDPSLYMEPVPLVPDAEGNWEPLVSEIWTDVEKMSKLAETNFKAELSRFRDFCDHYRTARGTIESMAGR